MSKKSKRSKRRRRAPKTKNYRTEKYVEYIFRAELGVFQADKLLPELTDGQVLHALRKLVARIRSSGLPYFREQPTDTKGLIAWLIVQGWEDLFRSRGRLSKQEMIGCLNTVIESAETHVRKPEGRSYLNFLEKFMKRAGVSVRAEPVTEFEGEEEEFYDLGQMSLTELGTLWLSKPEIFGIEDAFENQAHALMADGKADEVMAFCQELLEQTDEPYIRAVLHTLLGTAYRRLDDLQRAVTMFQAAQSPGLVYVEALDKLAGTYRDMGQCEQAIQTWRQCAEALPLRESWFVHKEIAATYHQMGDPAGEEAALRNLVAAKKRRGCLLLGWGKRDSIAALAQLTDFLRSQGRESEWQSLAARIRRSRPHIRADDFQDWAYWVREWMLIDEQDVPMIHLESFDGHEPGPVRWVPVLRAVLYDQMGRQRDAAPFWRRARSEIVGKPYDWVLRETRDILGELLPPSSQLFNMIETTRRSRRV